MTRAPLQRLHVLYIAWPIILSNISTPLLGVVDTAVIGNLGDASLIGAIAVGAMIFSFLFWGFGFLRMGTTGLIAQARGAANTAEIKATFYRAILLGLVIGIGLIALQVPITSLAFSLIDGSQGVEQAAYTYFKIRIWAAPISLIHLGVLGYLLGQQKSAAIFWVQLLLNGMNIFLDLIFVLIFEWGVQGVALATVISEAIALIAGIFIVGKDLQRSTGSIGINILQLKNTAAITRMLNVNRDIMIRTLCLIFAFALFTNQGAIAGDVLLASNAILMQFVTFSAFFLDGYALAGESLVGSAVGARDKQLLTRTLRYITELGLITACGLSLAFFLLGPHIIDLLTNVMIVRDTARQFLPWVVAAPLISLWCYLLDGVFIGATRTVEMRNAMLISLGIYLLAWQWLTPIYGNHGLWLSLCIYFIARAITLLTYLPRALHV